MVCVGTKLILLSTWRSTTSALTMLSIKRQITSQSTILVCSHWSTPPSTAPTQHVLHMVKPAVARPTQWWDLLMASTLANTSSLPMISLQILNISQNCILVFPFTRYTAGSCLICFRTENLSSAWRMPSKRSISWVLLRCLLTVSSKSWKSLAKALT